MPEAAGPASHANLYIHVRILLGMIVGLGLTHLLHHVARLVERPTAHRVYGAFAVAALLYELSWIWRRYENLA